tara:strand:+ start:1133 stop:2584 length:1452 start_codon:yes stop_codon:yes gene_type:complete
MKNLVDNKTIYNLFISFAIVCFIFLWDFNDVEEKPFLENPLLNFRYWILLLIFPTIFLIVNKIKNKNFFFYINFFLISFLFIFHILINQLLLEQSIQISTFYGLIFFLLIYIISYFNFDKITENLDLIIYIWIIIFVIASFISLINYEYDAPYFCGIVKNYFNYPLERHQSINVRLSDYNLSFKHILFNENSHIGMTAPAIIIYSIYKITVKQKNKLFAFCAVLFLIICLIKSSTTLLVGTIISIFVITLFNFRYIPKKTLIGFILIFFSFIAIILNDKQCKVRFIPEYDQVNFISKKVTEFTKNFLFKNDKKVNSIINPELQEKNCEPDCVDILSGSASSAVFFRSLLITKYSLSIRPFGWGMNRYSDGYDAYMKLQDEEYLVGGKFNDRMKLIYNYNRKGGVNNFNKIIVEFGYLSIFYFIFIFLYLIDRKIGLEKKLFFLPIILTQMIKGAGYFNGGFALILILMFFTYLYRDQKNKSNK